MSSIRTERYWTAFVPAFDLNKGLRKAAALVITVLPSISTVKVVQVVVAVAAALTEAVETYKYEELSPISQTLILRVPVRVLA